MNNKWVAAIGITLGMFAVAMDFSIVNTALPSIQKYLSASIIELQWVMNIFALFLSPFLVTMGRFADLFGRKRIFLIGVTIFTLSSLVAGLSVNIYWLIVSRAFQGLSTAIILPCTQALLSLSFPAKEKGRAMGIWVGSIGTGLAVGPMLGGIIVGTLGWRWIFFINLFFMPLCFIISFLSVKEVHEKKEGEKIDWLGLTYLFTGVLALVIAVTEGGDRGWSSPVFIGFLIVAGLCLTALVFAEKKSESPIIPFRLFFNRAFLSCAIANFVSIFYYWGAFFLLPLYLGNIRGETPFRMGYILLCITVPVVIFSPIVGKLTEKKISAKSIIILGLFMMALSALMQAFFAEQNALWYLIIALLLMGLGWTFMYGPATTVALSQIPSNFAGVASGALNTIQELGGAIGLAITVSIFRFRDNQTLIQGLKNKNLYLNMENSDQIRSLLADPEAATAKLSTFGQTGKELLPLFRQSFLEGYTSAMWLLFALSLLGAVVIIFFLHAKKRKQQ